jgi:hypothetical protein
MTTKPYKIKPFLFFLFFLKKGVDMLQLLQYIVLNNNNNTSVTNKGTLTMKVTFILKDFSDDFYNGFGTSELGSVGLLNMTNEEKYKTLENLSFCIKNVKMKIGLDRFSDRVELNSIQRGKCNYDFKIEPRRGYKLVTFEVTK